MVVSCSIGRCRCRATDTSVGQMTGRASERLVGVYDFAPAASCFRRKAAAGVEEAGFWPVISRPSLTTYAAMSSPFEYVAPWDRSSFSTRKGTTSVNLTAASSVLANPVTLLPSTNGLPFGALT